MMNRINKVPALTDGALKSRRQHMLKQKPRITLAGNKRKEVNETEWCGEWLDYLDRVIRAGFSEEEACQLMWGFLLNRSLPLFLKLPFQRLLLLAGVGVLKVSVWACPSDPQGLSVGVSVRPSVFSTRIPTSFICRSRDLVWLDSESLYVTCGDIYTYIWSEAQNQTLCMTSSKGLYYALYIILDAVFLFMQPKW